MFTSLVASLALIAASHAAVHSIDVGKGGITFDPNSLTANVGDLLEFHFFSGTGGHSVVSSTLASPCMPATDAFFSGYIPGSSTGEMTFVVNVTSTDPIWFYCSLASHCQFGMSGVVNPPPGSSISDYMSAAKNVTKASAPATEQGGVLTTISAAAGSASTSMSTSAGASAATTMPSSSGSGSGSTTSGATGTGTSTAASTAATTKASAAGRLGGDMSVVLGLGVFVAGLVALMA